MREIKFRAWSETEKKFCTVRLGAGYVSDVDRSNFGTAIPGFVYDWQQYTGLKDAKGKEIYEGDVVLAYFEEGEVYGRGTVEWQNESADYEITGINGYLCAFGLLGWTYEVLGDVYQNPELINK